MAAEKSRPPDLPSAISAYRQALERDARFLPSTLRLAALLQSQGKPQEAVALIKLAEKAGAPAEALEIAWGQALMEAKSYAEAEAVLRKAVKHAPKRPGARIALAATLEASGQTGAAEAELKRAIDELEEKAGLRQRLADLYIRMNRKEEALAQLDADMAAGGGSNLVRVRIAKLALSLDQLNRAEKELTAVVDEDPATPEALFTLGLVREARGELHNAISDLKRALAFESSPDLHMAMARTLIAVGKDSEALGHLDAVGERADALLERARIRLRRQEIDQALADADAAAELDPKDGRALFLKGQCLDLIGRSEEAALAWRGAAKASPELAEAYYRIGRYEMDRGQQSAALRSFRMAASKDVASKPWEGDLYFQLGYAEAATGSRSNAAAAFRRYLDLAPEDAPARPEAERQLARLGSRGS